MSISSSELSKEVKFSEYSSLHVCKVDDCEMQKSYMSAGQRAFQVKAMPKPAASKLSSRCDSQGGAAIQYLLDSRAVTPAELVGIENFISFRGSHPTGRL
jgi:hypothetical protein